MRTLLGTMFGTVWSTDPRCPRIPVPVPEPGPDQPGGRPTDAAVTGGTGESAEVHGAGAQHRGAVAVDHPGAHLAAPLGADDEGRRGAVVPDREPALPACHARGRAVRQGAVE